MTKFKWEFDKAGLNKFRKLDQHVQKRIVIWLDGHITNSENPRLWGKVLDGNLQALWRYRVGKYRIIADIHDDKFVVLVINANKRNDVYKK
ncbi:type II toxin-antitoxin system RelE/ParE family toxin (plasmid) [Lactobacillus sp. ESL0731]|uniref:type II toxin-antitoxin system RelE family toxin n=1 Tax=unclassified Lactobacillus TaxID=2620435 RepID=UPI0023F69AA2|nr:MULTISPECIES: type II toxin-antitoxin system RelE/ParE family toxin [unclassified Lactobacillus]WEV52094.1 type II toxin-antitoxin system RelE/ParE family toxin [Lactobacillus sp. ESL0700]WEV63215.1 type II toxin-antitoxin system RelE/ParE family toxin [Lactobacillus sp. ESL0731]